MLLDLCIDSNNGLANCCFGLSSTDLFGLHVLLLRPRWSFSFWFSNLFRQIIHFFHSRVVEDIISLQNVQQNHILIVWSLVWNTLGKDCHTIQKVCQSFVLIILLKFWQKLNLFGNKNRSSFHASRNNNVLSWNHFLPNCRRNQTRTCQETSTNQKRRFWVFFFFTFIVKTFLKK